MAERPGVLAVFVAPVDDPQPVWGALVEVGDLIERRSGDDLTGA